jgi:hypothetical protein
MRHFLNIAWNNILDELIIQTDAIALFPPCSICKGHSVVQLRDKNALSTTQYGDLHCPKVTERMLTGGGFQHLHPDIKVYYAISVDFNEYFISRTFETVNCYCP